MGYIYIASNPGFKKGLYKIGMTNEKPEKRIYSLSRSTSAPADFNLEYSRLSEQDKLVETRVHSILESCRFRTNKEFFKIKLQKAISTVEKVIELTEFESSIGTEISKHHDLIMSNYDPNLKLSEIHLINILMAASNGGMMKQLFRFPRDIVDGFLKSETAAMLLSISKPWACKIMKSFSHKASDLKIAFINNGARLKVFDHYRYYRCDSNWRFTEEFSDLFYNNKI